MNEILRVDAQRVLDSIVVPLDALDGAAVVVTGATGLVGRHVVALLAQASRRLGGRLAVTAWCRNQAKADLAFGSDIADGTVRIVVGDVAESSPALGAVDYIVHAASPATPREFGRDPVGVIRANVQGTANLLEVAQGASARLTYVSTMEVYGTVARATPASDVVLSEDALGVVDPLRVRSAYPESKRLAETLLVAYGAQYGVSSDIARLTHTYGPGMATSDDRVQAQFVRAAAAGERIVLQSDGSLRRTYTYAADAAGALLYLMLTASSRPDVSAFNIADDDARVSIRELAQAVLAAAGVPPDRLVVDLTNVDATNWSTTPGGTYVDSGRLRSLGWRPQFTLAEGMARTVAFARESLSEASA